MRTLFIFGLLFTVLISCKKDDQDLIGEWEVTAIRASESADWENASQLYQFTFDDESNVSVMLDVNRCGASYNRCSCGSMSFEPLACTEACCDSEFAQKVIEYLTKIESHEIDGDELMLKGKRFIRLKRR